MAGTVSMTVDQIAHVPVIWSDGTMTVPAPTDAAITSSDTTVATVVLTASATNCDVTPIKNGSVTVTVDSVLLGLSDSITVNVTAAVATSVTLNAAGVTFSPKP